MEAGSCNVYLKPHRLVSVQASREDTTERQGLTVMSDPFMFLKLPLKCFERTDFTFPRVNPSDPARITRRRLPLWKQLQSHIIVSTTVYTYSFLFRLPCKTVSLHASVMEMKLKPLLVACIVFAVTRARVNT